MGPGVRRDDVEGDYFLTLVGGANASFADPKFS
jgi:hypothetical protein